MKKGLFKFLFFVCAFVPFYAFAQPANDLCTNATSLTLGGPCVAGTTAAANDNITGTVGCQSGGAGTGHNDVWYAFTATGSIFTASITTSAPFAGNVEVTLIAGTCASGTVINSSCAASPSNVSFNSLTAGTTYYLVISNKGNGTPGPFTICNYTTTSSSCTANDDCFTATTVTLNAVGASSACITGCNTGAAPGLDFVGSGCEDMPNPTVWYTFTTGATAAQINVSVTSAALSDPEFTIFSNTSLCLGPYTILNCTEGSGGSAVSNSIAVTANQTYYIAVSDQTGDQGSFNLCITQNPDNSACNTVDNLTVTATSMGSPLAGPYQPGEQVTFQYTLTNWQQINCNYIGAFVPTFGNCWAASSFTTNGMPAIINTPLNVNGVIQTSPLGPQNPCAGTPAGSWNWFPAGAATYNVAGGSLPAGAPMGAGWYFLSSYNPATGACTGGDPTDPDNTYGDGNYPDCGVNTFDYTLRFTLTAGPSGNCGLGLTDCGVSIKTYADGEFGAWNNIGCTVDLPASMSPTLYCCPQASMTSANTATICSGEVASITLTSDIGTSYTWIAASNANVTGESTTTQTTSVLSNTLTNTSAVSQNVIYTVTPSASCAGIPQTVTITVNPTPTITTSSTHSLCAGTSGTISASGASTYTWNPSSTLSSPTGSLVTSTPTANVNYTVTATSAVGCTNTAVHTMTVVANPTVTVNSPTICSGTSTVLTAGTASTYTWSTGATTSTISVTPTVTTSYTVTGASAGCTATAVAQVSVNPTPTVAVNNATVCNGTAAVLTASNATTYSWSTGAGTASISVTPTTTTVYTVTGTTNGCNNVKTATVTVNSIPTTTASASGTLSCSTPTVNLNSTLAGQSYTWTAPAGGTLGTPNAQNTTVTGMPGTYTLFVQSAAGCTYTTTASVTQNTTAPTGVNAGANGTLTCGSSSVTLNGSVTTPTNATANWTGANVCGTATNFTTSACGAGVYTLTATNPANGCTATSTVQVFPSAGAPTVTNTPVTNTLTCTNTLVAVSISTTVSPVTYTWTGPGIVGATTNSVINVSVGGTYNYTVTNTGNNCTTAGSQSVSQNTTAPTTTATTTGTLTCATTTVSLNASLAGMSYTWTAPAGGSVGSANTQSTTASGAIGTYSLMVVNPSNGCSYTTTTSVTQNTTQPVFTASTTGTLTCATNTVTLNTAFAATGYTWTAPAGGSVGTANTQSTTASGVAGVYTLTATSPANGCSGTATTTVTQNTIAPNTTASVSGSVTCVTTTVNLNSTTAGLSYTWTAPAGSSISSGANSQNAIGSGTGDYTLSVMDNTNGCTSFTTATAGSDLSVPTGVSAGLSQTLTCATNPSVTLSGSFTSPVGTTANWLGGVCGSATSFTTEACAAGVYTLEAIHPNTGCVATSTVEVFPAPGAPTLTITPVTNSITCTNTLVSIDMQTTETTYSVSWSGPGIVGATTTNTIDVNQGGVYTVVITNTVSACSTPSNVTVPTNTSVITPVINGNLNLTCSAPQTTLDVAPSGAAYSYTWAGPGIVSGAGTATIIANAGGDYSVTVTETANGCMGIATVSVTASAGIVTAVITPVTSNSVITCTNTSVDLIVNSNPSSGVTYSWTPSATSQTVSAGAGLITCTVTNTSNGCTGVAQFSVSSNTTPPQVSVTDGTIACGATSTNLIATSNATNSVNWTTSGGTIASGGSTATITVNMLGQYSVTVTDGDNGCTSNVAVSNVVQNTFAAELAADPKTGTAPLDVNFASTGATSSSWTFGDVVNNTSTSATTMHTYNNPGTYQVMLVASNGTCIDTAYVTIEVIENSVIVIPNVFTPNGDNTNDIFKITAKGMKTLTCDIFNRWGQKMFTIGSENEAWDGKAAGGASAPAGTYFYMLKATGFDGKEYEQQGYLNLFR